MNVWEERAKQGEERKQRLLSFGPYAHGILVKAKNGLYVVDPEDSSVSTVLLQDGFFAEAEYLLAKSLVSSCGDVLVVGAHIGGHAVPLSKDCRELVAIEANPNTFTYLRANCLLDECHNIILHNIAAGEKAEKIQFLLNRENSGGSKRMPVALSSAPNARQHIYMYDNPEVIEIDSVSLDTILGPRVFDLIFMDIEGSEYFALKGMQQILCQAKALSVEFLPHHLVGVAHVEVDEFLRQIEPHFEWMYLPAYNSITPKRAIPDRINEMYRANECHDGIYFLKEISEEWLNMRGCRPT